MIVTRGKCFQSIHHIPGRLYRRKCMRHDGLSFYVLAAQDRAAHKACCGGFAASVSTVVIACDVVPLTGNEVHGGVKQTIGCSCELCLQCRGVRCCAVCSSYRGGTKEAMVQVVAVLCLIEQSMFLIMRRMGAWLTLRQFWALLGVGFQA